jgi:hypothetical protein
MKMKEIAKKMGLAYIDLRVSETDIELGSNTYKTSVVEVLNEQFVGKKIKIWRAESNSTIKTITYFPDIMVSNDIWVKVDEVIGVIKNVFTDNDTEGEYLNFMVDIITPNFEILDVRVNCIGLERGVEFVY